jgi:hypothetical protein
VNYKARLEHKQYLAQESPEPIYDISDCGLKTVPPGVFYRCKIARKEALLLQVRRRLLTSVLSFFPPTLNLLCIIIVIKSKAGAGGRWWSLIGPSNLNLLLGGAVLVPPVVA